MTDINQFIKPASVLFTEKMMLHWELEEIIDVVPVIFYTFLKFIVILIPMLLQTICKDIELLVVKIFINSGFSL